MPIPLDRGPQDVGDILRQLNELREQINTLALNGPIEQGALNPNASTQGIASLSSGYNEIAVYGNYPAASDYTAIAGDDVSGLVYTTTPLLELSAAVGGIVSIATNILLALSASVTPNAVGGLMIQATSDTSLTFKYCGSDSVVRSASLVLAPP